MDDLAATIRGVDLLLAHPALIAAPVAAEHVGVRWGTISVFPGLIPTVYAPPAPTRVALGSGRTGRAIHRAAWRTARFNMARLFDAPVNRARRRLGVPAVSDSFFAPVDSGQPYLVMASPAVIDRRVDWPQNVTLTGFVIWDRARSFPDPDGLDEFLSVADPPVLVTLGASSSLDAQHFYRDAAAAVTGLGHRALVLTGPTPAPVQSRYPSSAGSSAPASPRCPGSPPAAKPPSTTAASGQRSRCSGPGCLRWSSLEALTNPRPRSG